MIGVGLLLLLMNKLGFSTIKETVLQFRAIYFLPAVVLWFLGHIGGVINVQIMLLPIKLKTPFKKIFRYYTLSWVSGLITPGRIGQLLLAYFFKKEGLQWGESMIIPLIDRAITLVAVLLVAYVGFLMLFGGNQVTMVLLASFLVFVAGCVVVYARATRELIKKYILKKYAFMFKGFSKALKKYIESYHILVINFFVSLLKLVLNACFIFVLFLGFDTSVSIISILAISAIVTLLSLIPISINGLGIRETTAVYLFSLMGVASSVVASVFILVIAVNYGLAAILSIVLTEKKAEEIRAQQDNRQ